MIAPLYTGEWLGDRCHGYGVHDDVMHGEKYLGMWQNDVRHGDGLLVTLDGMYFEGNFQYGKLLVSDIFYNCEIIQFHGHEISCLTLMKLDMPVDT